MKNAVRLVFHVMIAAGVSLAIVTIVAGVFVAPLVKWVGSQSFLGIVLGGLYSPQIWAPGLLLGYLINRTWQDRSACWVWVVGVGWLAYGIWAECRVDRFPAWYPAKGDFLQRAWHMFFTSNDAKTWGDTGLLLFLFTMPALNTITYSVGARLALHSRSKDAELEDRGTVISAGPG